MQRVHDLDSEFTKCHLQTRKFSAIRYMQQWCRHTHKQGGIFIPGSGRFGLVMKAQAHGIAPDQPHLNIVAVKTTKRGEGNINERFSFLRLDLLLVVFTSCVFMFV